MRDNPSIIRGLDGPSPVALGLAGALIIGSAVFGFMGALRFTTERGPTSSSAESAQSTASTGPNVQVTRLSKDRGPPKIVEPEPRPAAAPVAPPTEDDASEGAGDAADASPPVEAELAVARELPIEPPPLPLPPPQADAAAIVAPPGSPSPDLTQ